MVNCFPTAFVDSHSGQQISHTNPMEKNRRPTNSLYIFAFIIIVIAWFGLCVSGKYILQSKIRV